MSCIMILNFLSVKVMSQFFTGIDDDELVYVTSTLDGASTSFEATGCSNADLSKDCSELTVSVSEAMVVLIW